MKTTAAGLTGVGLLPQVASGQAQEIGPGETVTGTIRTDDDYDRFELPVKKGDVVEITFEKDPSDSTYLYAHSPSFSSDPDIRLDGAQEQLTGRYTIDETGSLDITVSAYDSNQEYAFTAAVDTGADKWPDQVEIEPGETITGTVSTNDDADRFELPVKKGDVVEITFEKDPSDSTYLYAHSPSFSSDPDIRLDGAQEQLTGRYTIDETGSLDITVSAYDSNQEYRFVVNGDLDEMKDTLAVVLSPTSVTANTTTDVTVTVSADRRGAPERIVYAVEGATVAIPDLDLSASTDIDGKATLPVNAPAGDYPVSINAEGFVDTTETLTVRQNTNDSPADPVAEYRDPQTGEVGITGLRTAIGDFTSGEIEIDTFRAVIDAFAS